MSTSEPAIFAGVDVGAGRLDAAMISVWSGAGGSASSVRCRFLSLFAGPVGELADFCRPAQRVGVDAPGGLSAGAHLEDLSVAPKFRTGRCSEIPLPGVPPVPWVTPSAETDAPGWMLTGFDVWAALVSCRLDVVEVFPAAVFHQLNGGRWPPKKSTPAGCAARLSLLSKLVWLPPSSSEWTHDQLDAVACAVVGALGRPADHACGRPDGSVMWIIR